MEGPGFHCNLHCTIIKHGSGSKLTRAFSFETYDFRQVSTMVNMYELYGSKKAFSSLLMTFRGALKPQM